MSANGRSETQKIIDAQFEAEAEKTEAAIRSIDSECKDWEASRSIITEGFVHMSKRDQITHAGLKDVSTKLDTVKSLITSSNVHVATVNLGPVKNVPVKYLVAVACVAICAAVWLVDRSLTHDRFNELAEGINIIRGKPSASVFPGNPSEAISGTASASR